MIDWPDSKHTHVFLWSKDGNCYWCGKPRDDRVHRPDEETKQPESGPKGREI